VICFVSLVYLGIYMDARTEGVIDCEV
jgi:hypothetical protein